ncbi:MAG: glycosyltransferase family 9 protein [Dehalococcoidia bacterium]|jgi:lipopolysaccharide heptosyltransferase II
MASRLLHLGREGARFVADWAYLVAVTAGSLFRRRRREGDIRSILVLCTAGIGDALWSTPVLRALRARHPDAAIAVLVSQKRGTRQVFEGSPFVDECIVVDWDYRALPGGLARFLRLLRGRSFDMTVFTFPGAGIGSRLLAHLIGAPVRAGYKGFGSRFLLTLAVPLDARQHSLKINLDLASAVGAAIEDARLDLPIDEGDRAYAEELTRKNGDMLGEALVGVHPGGFPDIPEKAWPSERFAQVIDALQENAGVRVLLFGGPQDDERVGRILSSLKGGPPLLATGLTLRQMAALFQECRVLITNDCGPLRVAEAVGTPAIALFGPTDPALVGPYEAWAGRYIVIRKQIPCGPCYHRKRIRCPYDAKCMDLITAEEVVNAARVFLESRGGPDANDSKRPSGEGQHAKV